MNYKGVIFDFNGTLFWDTHYHNQAWDLFLKNHDLELTEGEKLQKIMGRTNQDILRGIFNRPLSDIEISSLTVEKESIYQEMCLENHMELATGATDFFRFLMVNNIPFTIASASGKENIDFYFEHLALDKWFVYDKVVYNDGSFRGKPFPDLYLAAADKLKLDSKELIVFEDSFTGIYAAENAGAGKIVIVNSDNADYQAYSYDIITNFGEVDRKLFAHF
jgi:beta-phosphoglucomutase